MKRVKEFLRSHWDGRSPLLLGYSGGPDSKALLYSLLDAGCSSLHVAHVDHAWREESQEEADSIRKEIESLELPFYTVRLSLPMRNNLEDRFRKERFSFFKSLFQKIPFQALLLGHQADDRAETVLKRFFEGAHLSFLGGMQDISTMEGLFVWRPLLKVKKKEIFAFLQKRSLVAFLDPTNQDAAYLRARLRMETLPFLTRSFGKSLVDNLALFSDRVYELQKYLDEKVANHPIQKGDWGWAVYLYGLPKVEMRHLLQRRASEEGLVLPRTVLEPVLDWISDIHEERKIYFHLKWIVVFQGWVFFLNASTGKALPEKGMIRKLVYSLAKKENV